jgi:hypothetical protein
MTYQNRQLKARLEKRKRTGLKGKDLVFLAVFGLTMFGLGKRATVNTVAIVERQVERARESVPVMAKEVDSRDDRVIKLEGFLQDKDSPLASYAQLIVDEADKYDIGWTKLVSISAAESNYCINTKPDSFNCWGIGGRKFVYFGSYEEGIKFTSKLLGENYKKNEIRAVQQKYCPSFECNPNWVPNVLGVSNSILAQD